MLNSKYPQKNKVDVAFDLTEIALQFIPIAGGPLATVLSKYNPKAISKRIDNWMIELENSINKLDRNIKVQLIEYLNTEEGGTLLGIACENALKTHKIEKIQTIIEVLNSAILNSELIYDEKELLVNTICSLEPYDISVLLTIKRKYTQISKIKNLNKMLEFILEDDVNVSISTVYIIINRLKAASMIRVSPSLSEKDEVFENTPSLTIAGATSTKPTIVITEIGEKIIQMMPNKR